jgi:hypothetical protein
VTPVHRQENATTRLTLVLCSRNDRWQGNSLWRLEATLNYTAAQVADIERLKEVEIIVADWGSAEPLRDAIKLSPQAAQIVRYLNIPPALAKEKQRDSPFAEVYAINAAVRRSRGDFIGRIDQDTLVGKRFLQWFFKIIESPRASFPIEKTAMISNRRRIPYDFAVRCPPFPIVRKYLDLCRAFLPRMVSPLPDYYWACFVGIVLLHRDLWGAAGGYDETFIYYGAMEFDLFLRLLMRFQGLDLSPLVSCDFYHLDHVPTWAVWRLLTRSINPLRTPENPPPVLCPNGESWGLANYELPLLPPNPSSILQASAFEWRPSWTLRLLFEMLVSTIVTLSRIARGLMRRQIMALRANR